MSESDPVFIEDIVKCEDTIISHASTDNPGTMPTFQTIDIIETQENNNQEFVNETASVRDDDSTQGSGGSELETHSEGPGEVSDSETVVKLESDENSNSVKESNDMCVNDEHEVQSQEDNDNTTSKSWPTLEILPGGIIRPTETEDEYPYCIYIDQPAIDSEELMYACAKCPMRFKVLNLLTMHLRTHAEEKKRNEGLEAYKKLKFDMRLYNSADFERRLLVLKKKRVHMETEYKKRQIIVMTRIANAFATMGPDFLD